MRTLTEKTPVTKGWSGDRKYCVTDESGQRYLLRVSDASMQARKRTQFRLMQQVAALGVPMCLPVEFGLCDEGVYSLQTWIDGEEAEGVIRTLPPQAQYAYGLDAGRVLRKIHTIPAPSDLEDWESRFGRKMDGKIRKYTDCPLKYKDDHAFFDYIRENRHLLKNRPQCYQHGDYHTGNMMIDRERRLQIVDFDRDDYGDPWEEFNRIVWCVQESPRFACGMVDGYFDGPAPLEFWRLLALYIASNTLSSLFWAIPFGEAQVQIMRDQAKDVLNWYDGMRNPVPSWYGK